MGSGRSLLWLTVWRGLTGAVEQTAQAALTDTASGPLAPCTTPTQTVWPSISGGMPLRWRADACTKTSLPLSEIATKPKPLVALYHLTVPRFSTAAPRAGPRPGWDGERGEGAHRVGA